MASHFLNQIALIAPWPQLALTLAGQECWRLGPSREAHTLAWQRDAQLGLTLHARGLTRRSPPLGDCLQFSAQSPDRAALIAYCDETGAQEGWAIACDGEMALSQEPQPRLAGELPPRASLTQAIDERFEQRAVEIRRAFLASAQGAVCLARASDTARKMEPLLLALENAQPARIKDQLCALLEPGMPFSGLAAWQAAALLDAPEALDEDSLDRPRAVQALALAPLSARLFPRGGTPGGRFLAAAERLHPGCSQERQTPDQSSAGARLSDLLCPRQRLLSANERGELLTRTLLCSSSRRALSAQSAQRLILNAGQHSAPLLAQESRAIAVRLMQAQTLTSDQLLALALSELQAAPGSAMESLLIDIASHLPSDARQRLAEPAAQLGLARLPSALESWALSDHLPPARSAGSSRL